MIMLRQQSGIAKLQNKDLPKRKIVSVFAMKMGKVLQKTF